jgi:hypothetical protein
VSRSPRERVRGLAPPDVFSEVFDGKDDVV